MRVKKSGEKKGLRAKIGDDSQMERGVEPLEGKTYGSSDLSHNCSAVGGRFLCTRSLLSKDLVEEQCHGSPFITSVQFSPPYRRRSTQKLDQESLNSHYPGKCAS